jgi:pyridoxine/pyridoxamine 5'-phosphate oxidase
MTKAELIAENRYMVLSTADPFGRPWASPVWFAPDGEDGFLWISRPDTRHSLNIAERPEIAIVIFEFLEAARGAPRTVRRGGRGAGRAGSRTRSDVLGLLDRPGA